MKNTSLAIIAACALLAVPAHAQRVSKINGGQLLNYCASTEFGKTRNCEAYLDGVADAISEFMRFSPHDDHGRPVNRMICIPLNVTGKDLRLTVLKGLRADPSLQSLQAVQAVGRILHQTYPCH